MNEAGRDRFTSKLTVESAPKIKLGAGRVNADINDPVTLECETEGFFNLNSKYQKSTSDHFE